MAIVDGERILKFLTAGLVQNKKKDQTDTDQSAHILSDVQRMLYVTQLATLCKNSNRITPKNLSPRKYLSVSWHCRKWAVNCRGTQLLKMQDSSSHQISGSA